MTSRRSRLKAVANLPVRRKLPVPQGATTENTQFENITPEKTLPSSLNADEINVPTNSTNQNHESENNVSPLECQNSENGVPQELDLNSTSDIQSTKNSEICEVTNNNLEIIENNNDLNRNCNLNSTKMGSSNPTPFKGRRSFKPNIVTHERRQSQKLEAYELNQNTEKLSPDDITNNSKNNNIIEDGTKSYTVLTSQNLTMMPGSNYTITPLTPCVNINTSSDTNESDMYNHSINQEFGEIQIYTVEPTEICIENEINDSNKSLIESEPLAPALNNCTMQNPIHNISVNLNCNRTSLMESTNTNQSIFVRPSVKNGAFSAKVNGNLSEDYNRPPVSTAKEKSILGNSVTAHSQSTPSDVNAYKQGISTFRRKRSKCNDFTKKLADARREFQKKYEKTKPDRSTLRMIDLIFYNPTTNPMESKAKFEKKDSPVTQPELINEMLSEEKVDEPEPVDSESSQLSGDNSENDNLSKMPVPQVKIGLNGEIILDEKSLIIETTDAKKGREDLQNSIPIFEDRGSKVSYYRGKSRKTRDWTDFETKRFYKALNTIGPDFSLMQKYFPKRSRLELKNKFKREERLNRNLIDRALNNPSEFDMTQLEEDLAVEKRAEEEEVEMRLCKGLKQATKRPRIRSSFLSREMVESDGETENNVSKADSAHSKKIIENEKNKKRKENNFIFQRILMKESETELNNVSENSSSIGVLSRVEHAVT